MADAPELPQASEARSHTGDGASRASIAQLVFQSRESRPGRRIAAAAALAGGIFGLAAVVVLARDPGLGPWSAELAAPIHARVANQQAIEVLPPAPPAPPPPPPSVTEVAKPAPVRAAGRRVRRASAVAPAQAAPIITRAAADSPLDLTGTTFSTGGAAALPGGATAGAGRSSGPVAGAVDIHARPARQETVVSSDRSRPVTLAVGTWSCFWPAQADAEQIDEQTVVIRVRVHEDGRVDAAEVLSDPGHGFGSAAMTCARRTHFQAARNGVGVPIAAWSPPIRVHFSR